MSILRKLWKDEAGFILSSELVLAATLLVIGMVVGLTTVRNAVVQELADVGSAISKVNQSYSYSGVAGHHTRTEGSSFADLVDFCDSCDVRGEGANCVTICSNAPRDES
jgi:hypothetical protein